MSAARGTTYMHCLFPLGTPFPAGAESRGRSYPSIHPTLPSLLPCHRLLSRTCRVPDGILDIRLSWHGGAMGLSLSRARRVASQPCDIAAPSIAFLLSRNCPSGSHVRRPEREADFESGRTPERRTRVTMTNTDEQFNAVENMVDAFCIQCAEDTLETDVCNTCKIRIFHDFCESRLCGNCNKGDCL